MQCKLKLQKEVNEIDRRAEQRDRYSRVNVDLLTPTERKYVSSAAKGMSVSEIADIFGVSKQCVSASLLVSEKKTRDGTKISKKQEDMRISLETKVAKAKKKLDEAMSCYELARILHKQAQTVLESYEESLDLPTDASWEA